MRAIVSGGGLGIIASVLGILVFIVWEVVPLARRPGVEVLRQGALSAGSGTDNAAAYRAAAGDEYRTHVATLGEDGVARVFRVEDGAMVVERPLLDAASGERLTLSATPPGSRLLAGVSELGRVVIVEAAFDVGFDGDRREVTARLGEPVWLELGVPGRAVGSFAAHLDADGNAVAAAAVEDVEVVVVRREATRNLMSGAVTATSSRFVTAVSDRVSALVLDADLRNLYAGTSNGNLIWWPLDGEPDASGAPPALVTRAGSAAVTALTLLIGDRSLVVGQADGGLSVWFPVRQADDSLALTRIRRFPSQADAIELLAPSARNKAFLAHDRSGGLGLYYSTSERVLWRGASPLPGATAATFSPKADGAFLLAPGRLAAVAVDNPHPEISPRALFGKVWYEGYGGPAHVWQSTGGTDDFESKMGLTPLIVGTLKGTVYSLLIAIPLGVLGAMYASQFMHPKLMRVVKPFVEIMAALPSVVLGFLAGLWLAPRVEKSFPALILMVVAIPLVVLLTGAAWSALPKAFRNRFASGAEAFLFALTIALTVAVCLRLSQPFADLAFGGNFQDWLLRTTGLPYDQRNAVVVGLAMGFAVIPIIFAIAEDAFSNVPKILIAGSLALGANRWQTVTRVVLPTASPGIFSAVMIGFGRAVGETMIVLMATGNTPIMDANPFNGFRTLSANIAVEIPEAPVGGTLYRVLFLAALILFVMTFTVNTVAELVRQRLRRKFAQL